MLILSPFDRCISWDTDQLTDLHNYPTSEGTATTQAKQVGSTVYAFKHSAFLRGLSKCDPPNSSREWIGSIRNANYWAPLQTFQNKVLWE